MANIISKFILKEKEGTEKVQRSTWAISTNATRDEVKAGYFRLFLFKHTDGRVGAMVWVRPKFSIGQFVIDCGWFPGEKEYGAMVKKALDIEVRKSISGNIAREAAAEAAAAHGDLR